MSECLICWPRGVMCESCQEKEATHVRVAAHDVDLISEVLAPMCHGCAMKHGSKSDA